MELDEFRELSKKLDATQFWIFLCIRVIGRETSINEIEEIIPLAKRTIQRIIKELKEVGLINIRTEKKSNLISENIASVMTQSEENIASVVSQSGEIASVVSQSTQDQLTHKKPITLISEDIEAILPNLNLKNSKIEELIKNNRYE